MLRKLLLLALLLGLVTASPVPVHADTQTLSITAGANNGVDEGGVWSADFLAIDPTSSTGLSFITTAAITSGATINPSYVRLFATFDDTASMTVSVAVENADPTTNTAFSSSHLPSAATYFTAGSSGAVNFAVSTFYFGVSDAGVVNIASQIQSLLNTHGTIAVGERINIELSYTSGDAGVVQFEPFGAAGTNEPDLFIDWTAAGASGLLLRRRRH